MNQPDILLKAERVSVNFPTGPAITDISFELQRGDFLALIGPNGSGKTVLVRTLLGSLPYTGSVEWAPNVKIGYVPQQLDWDRSLSLTLKDFLELKTSILKLPKTVITKVLSQVGLANANLDTPLRFLSGGQVQRGLIAFALIGDPDVIFFDEPTASVDSPGEEQIYETLHRLQDESDLSIILVSHELDLVSKFATKILCINRRMVCFGDLSLSLKPEVLEKLYGSHNHVHQLK